MDATDPPPATPTPTPALLRADMKVLMGYINGARAIAFGRETIIRDIKGWLLVCLFSGLLIAALLLAMAALVSTSTTKPQWPAMFAGLVLILVTGRTGAILSVARRVGGSTTGNIMSVDAILELAGLELGKNGFRISIWSATVFAMVVYIIFGSGLPATLGFSGGLAPVFIEVERSAAADRIAGLAQASFAARAKADEEQKACDGSKDAPNTKNVSDAAVVRAVTAETPVASGSAATDATPASGAVGDANKVDPAKSASPDAGIDSACKRAKDARKAADSAHSDAMAALQTPAVYRIAGGRFGSWTDQMAEALGVATVPDLFKLLVWAFLAGWAEQLVPDILDTMRRKHEAGLRKDVEAAAGQPTVPSPGG